MILGYRDPAKIYEVWYVSQYETFESGRFATLQEAADWIQAQRPEDRRFYQVKTTIPIKVREGK